MFASRFASPREASDADDDVRERFVRVVGLPENVVDPPEDVVDAPEDQEVGSAPPAGPPVAAPATWLDSPASGSGGLRSALSALDPGRRGVRALAAVAVVAIAVAGFLAWRARPHVEPVGTRTEQSPAANTSSSPSGAVVVAVSGRVRRPGLIRLPSGARVADAIEAAGGALPDTDLSFVNLARKLTDGELVTVGVTPPPGAGAGPEAGGAPAGPLNLNTATVAQLDTLPGVGPVLAQHILDYRTRHGQFRSVDELRQVEGFGTAKFNQVKPLVTV